MKLSTVGRHFREGFKNIGRNGWMTVASIISVSVTLLILGVCILLAFNVNFLAEKLEAQVEIKAFVELTAGVAEVAQVERELQKLEGVEEIIFVSKATGMEEYIESMGEVGEHLREFATDENNPLPDSFVIRASNPREIAQLAEKVDKLELIYKVHYGSDTTETLFAVTSAIKNVGIVFIVGLAFTAMLLIANTIKITIFARRNEIEIMKLVGATNGFIRWPFFVEGNVVHSIYRYPTHQTFFSTPEKLEIGAIPFIIEQKKPKRNQALAYYREVARIKKLNIHTYEQVTQVVREATGDFKVISTSLHYGERVYRTPFIVVATGYYDSPNLLDVPGEDLPKVLHYFKEAHPYYNQDIVVIGGKNSAVDATLELEKAGARVTVLYRGTRITGEVKPWILPEFQSLINHGKITMEYGADLLEITPTEVVYEVHGVTKRIKNDFVMAMTGYHPDHSFLTKMGVKLDQETGRPTFNPETMESNISKLFIAGVIAAGNEANEIFIENGRFHGELIAAEIMRKIADSKLNAQP